MDTCTFNISIPLEGDKGGKNVHVTFMYCITSNDLNTNPET
jgi:hypothetical protein